MLAAHPQVLVIEDDYIADVAGAPYAALHGRSDRWAVVRSVSKVLGPDLRLATLAADPLTTSRVAGRQLLGAGWVSHLLQQTVVTLRSDATARRLLARAERRYAARRARRRACRAWHHRARPVRARRVDSGRGGDGDSAGARRARLGPGERFRYRSAPGIRVTISTLQPADARRLADDVATAVGGQATTYAG